MHHLCVNVCVKSFGQVRSEKYYRVEYVMSDACTEQQGDGEAELTEAAGMKEPERNGKFNFL